MDVLPFGVGSAERRLIKKSLIKLKNFLRKLKKSLICIDKTAQMCVKYKYEIDLDTPLCNAYHVGVDFIVINLQMRSCL